MSIVAMSIIAVGTSRFGLDGGNLIGNAANWHGAGIGVMPQFLDNVFPMVLAVILFKPGEGFGQNVVVVHVLETRLPGDVQPQTMEQEDVLILHGGRVGTDAEGVDVAVWDARPGAQTAVWVRVWLPRRCPRSKACSAVVILLETPATTAEDSRLLRGLHDGRPGVASGHHQQ